MFEINVMVDGLEGLAEAQEERRKMENIFNGQTLNRLELTLSKKSLTVAF